MPPKFGFVCGEVPQAPPALDPAERKAASVDAKGSELVGENLQVIVVEVLLDGVGTQRFDRACDVDGPAVHRVPKPNSRAPANDDAAGLEHETRHIAHRAADDQGAALHRYPRPRAGVAFDVDSASPDRRSRTGAGVP